jgi:hypothetical protein
MKNPKELEKPIPPDVFKKYIAAARWYFYFLRFFFAIISFCLVQF